MVLDHFMLPDATDIAAVAHGDVRIVATQHHLGTFGDDVAVTIDTGIDGGLAAAIADGLDLLDLIGQLHQPHRAGEQAGLEIGTQAEADHRHIVIIYNGPQLLNLLGSHELALVHDHHVAPILAGEGEELIHIGIRGHDLAIGLQADAAAQDAGAVTGIGTGFDEPHLLVVFFLILLGNQGLGRLTGTHGAVFEIKLCHLSLPPFGYFIIL